MPPFVAHNYFSFAYDKSLLKGDLSQLVLLQPVSQSKKEMKSRKLLKYRLDREDKAEMFVLDTGW